MLKLVGLVFLISASGAFASRSLYVPPYDSYSSGGDVTGTPVNGVVGIQATYSLQLRNTSNVLQNGAVKVLPGFNANGGIWTNASGTTVNTPFGVLFFMCGGTAAQGGQGTAPATFASGTTMNFAIPPRSIRGLTIGAYFYAIRTNQTSFSLSLSPALQIEITEDQGAVLGTLTPMYLASTGSTLCSGAAVNPSVFPSFVGTNTPIQGTPVFINGGRAF